MQARVVLVSRVASLALVASAFLVACDEPLYGSGKNILFFTVPKTGPGARPKRTTDWRFIRGPFMNKARLFWAPMPVLQWPRRPRARE